MPREQGRGQIELPLKHPQGYEGMEGNWLPLAYDWAALPSDLEVIFLEYRVRALRRARLSCPRKVAVSVV